MNTDQRLSKLEEKLDNMHTDLVEIKTGLKFANNLAKAIGAIVALVIAFFSIK